MKHLLTKCPICGAKLYHDTLKHYTVRHFFNKDGKLSQRSKNVNYETHEAGVICCSECDFSTNAEFKGEIPYSNIEISIQDDKYYWENLDEADEEKEEFVELMTRGQFVQKGGSYYITYKETETTGYEGCTTTLKIAVDGSRVVMLRFGKNGGVGTQLQIEKGKRNLCHYETGFGSMTLGVTADEIVNELTEKGGTVRFAYLLDANSADLVSRNRLEVTVTHVN